MRHRTASLLLLALGLFACDHGEDYHGGNPAVSRLDVRTVPSTSPRPGDTLTFYALFPDSTSERYLISWNTDARGRTIPSACLRGTCAKWIVPLGKGTYNHSIKVTGSLGGTIAAFSTVVP